MCLSRNGLIKSRHLERGSFLSANARQDRRKDPSLSQNAEICSYENI